MKAVTYTIKHDIIALSGEIDHIIKTININDEIDEQLLFEIKVILNELIVNAICHGNKCNLDKVAFVTYKIIQNKYIYISVKDEGRGNKLRLDAIDVDKYIESVNSSYCEHGRGLLIVEQLCYRTKMNKCGNKVSVIKRIK